MDRLPDCVVPLSSRLRGDRRYCLCLSSAFVWRALERTVDFAATAFLALPAIGSSISACPSMRLRPSSDGQAPLVPARCCVEARP